MPERHCSEKWGFTCLQNFIVLHNVNSGRPRLGVHQPLQHQLLIVLLDVWKLLAQSLLLHDAAGVLQILP